MEGTAGSKSCDSKPAMRLRRASTSLLSAAVLGAPCTVEGMGPVPASCCRVAVLNLSPRVGSSSSKARWDLHIDYTKYLSSALYPAIQSMTGQERVSQVPFAISTQCMPE